MPNKTTIYSRYNPQLLKLFERAGHPAKVLCVALDYAKAQHTALICNGVGDLLKPSFAIENTAPGAAQLLKEVRACAQSRKVRCEHVFFGGEDYPSYAENFVRQLRQEQFLVVRVNAWEAKQQRDNFQASSDSLDLLGIARCCLHRQVLTALSLGQAVFFQGSMAPVLARTLASTLSGNRWSELDMPADLKDGTARQPSHGDGGCGARTGDDRSQRRQPLLHRRLRFRSRFAFWPSAPRGWIRRRGLMVLGVLSEGLSAVPPDSVLTALGPILHSDYLAWKRGWKARPTRPGQSSPQHLAAPRRSR